MAKKNLITPTQAKRLNELATKDPERALKELKYTVAARGAIDRASKFSFDAIQKTPKRKRPSSTTGSLDQEFTGGDGDRNTMVATLRDLFQNFGFAKGLLRAHVKNVVGSGPIVQATTDDEEFNRQAEAYWNTRKDRLDIRGMLGFTDMLDVGEQREIVDGDYGLAIVRGGFLQAIEGDRIKDPPADKKAKNRIYESGVEMTREGRPVAYHVYNRGRRPGQMRYAKRIDADDFIFCYRADRFDQVRGISWPLSSTNDLVDLKETMEAAKGKWKIENMLGVAIKSAAPESADLFSLWGGRVTPYEAKDSKGDQDEKYEIKLGQGVHSFELAEGEEIQVIESKSPNNNFEPFTYLLIRMAALCMDMPLEIALQYYTRGSYSSHRAAFLQYYQSVYKRRGQIERIKLDRIYNWVIQRAIKAKELPRPKGNAPSFSHKWQWPGLPLLDPDRERRADKEAYKLAVVSLADIEGRDGNFWQDVAERRLKEIKWIQERAKEIGVDPAYAIPQVADPGQEAVGSTETEGVDDDDGDDGDDDND